MLYSKKFGFSNELYSKNLWNDISRTLRFGSIYNFVGENFLDSFLPSRSLLTQHILEVPKVIVFFYIPQETYLFLT